MEVGMRNPHSDRNPFKSFTGGFQQGWRDRRQPAVPLPIDTMERGGTPAVPLPKVTGPMPGTIPKDIMGRGRMPAIPLPRVSGESFRGPLNPLHGDNYYEGTMMQDTGFHPKYLEPMSQKSSIGDQASYVPSERVYPRFVIDDLLKQGVTFPDELKQIGSDSWQITPRGMDPKPLRPSAYYTMNKGLDNWGGNLKGTFDQPGYGDPSSLNPWGQDWDYRDDDYDVNVLDPGFNDYGPGPLYFG